MNKILVYKLNCVNPRLSDEEPDPLEQDDSDLDGSHHSLEGWLPWTSDDLLDIERIIATRLPKKQRFILEAFLEGKSHNVLGVTEKYFRYHFMKAVETIKKELKL